MFLKPLGQKATAAPGGQKWKLHHVGLRHSGKQKWSQSKPGSGAFCLPDLAIVVQLQGKAQLRETPTALIFLAPNSFLLMTSHQSHSLLRLRFIEQDMGVSDLTLH